MSDETWIAKTIAPKSDQLNAEDLITGPATVTVMDVQQAENRDQPVAILIDGDRQPYKPCKTMRRLLVAIWGERAKEWVGRQMTLYCDPDVKWGGVAVGGIRISHLSHIDKPHTVMLSVTRGKRKAVTIEPLAANTAAPSVTRKDVIEKWRPVLSEAPGEIKEIANMIRGNAAGSQIDEAVDSLPDELASWRSKLAEFDSEFNQAGA